MGRTSEAREKLLNSSIELITQRSFTSVGVQELCNHAGVKKGSFYHFFNSKQDLTIASLDIIWNDLKNGVLIPIKNAECSLEEKLNLLHYKFYEHYKNSKECKGCIAGCPLGNLALEMSTLDENIRVKVEEIFNKWVEFFEEIIADAQRLNEIPQNVNTKATAKSIVAYIEGLSLLGKAFNNIEIIKNLGCVIKRILIYD
ncbi:MAG: TetR/AcrR family transcriptional regulator, partial [Thermodesulfobacteriota bacterium]